MEVVRRLRALPAVWIGNEAASVLPSLLTGHRAAEEKRRFVLMQDGVPRALTGPHGQSIDWIA